MCISFNTFCQQIVIATELWLFLWSFLFCVSGQLHFNLLRVTLITQWIIARHTYYSVNHCASHLLLSESLRVALITQWIIARRTYYSVNHCASHLLLSESLRVALITQWINRHDIAEISLKVALNTINQTKWIKNRVIISPLRGTHPPEQSPLIMRDRSNTCTQLYLTTGHKSAPHL